MKKREFLAKPSGITLDAHTQHVREEAAYILERLPFLSEKYRRLCGGNLSEDLELAVRYHDWGKAYPKWQNACRADYEAYLQWREQRGMSKGKLTAAEYRNYETELYSKGKLTGAKLFKAKLRHEIASLHYIETKKKAVPEPVKAAIAAHHGKLSWRHKTRWEQDGASGQEDTGPFVPYWENLCRLSDSVSRKRTEDLLVERFRYGALRSLLQLADTRASRKEGEGDEAAYTLGPYPIVKRFSSLRPVQEAALSVANQGISILRAATGSGKTYAALLWAEEKVKQRKADRLVIAMPTRFTSNALAIGAADQLGETGLYHSSAWFNRYGGLNDTEAKKEAKEAHRMARFLATPVTVCTIDHLLISLTGTKEHHHSTFYFLANSAVVLDEADFYDPFIQANIVVLIDLLRKLDVPMLIMSATVPDSARVLYGVETPITVPKPQPRKAVKRLQYIGSDEEKENDVLKRMLEAGHGIIYANTVSRALSYYKRLEEQATEKQIPLVLYHSRFTEPDKKEIEEKLIGKLGKDAWAGAAQSPVRGIAIMTQIGEMSVNISTPIMLSDMCPWDRLAQRIGRLVRFDAHEEGICYVVQPQKNGALYPAPYGQYSREKKRWEAASAMLKTQQQLEVSFLEAKAVSPEDFVRYVNELYPDAPALSDYAEGNQNNYRKLIKLNWLILPDTKADEDEGHVGDKWSSRDVPPQRTIYVKCPHNFSSYDELQSFGLEYGVSVPIYLVEKELRKGKDKSRISAMSIKLGKSEEKELPVHYTMDYSSERGLAFLYDDDFKSDVSQQMS